MICVYCGLSAGFLKSSHTECKMKYDELMVSMNKILQEFISESIDRASARSEILAIVSSPQVLKKNQVFSERIKAGEITLSYDFLTNVTEYKNHCTFQRRNSSYNLYPTYSEGWKSLGDCNVVITNKKVNIIPTSTQVKRVSLDLDKIISLKLDDKKITIEVKTTSEAPHRVSLEYLGGCECIFNLIKCFSKI